MKYDKAWNLNIISYSQIQLTKEWIVIQLCFQNIFVISSMVYCDVSDFAEVWMDFAFCLPFYECGQLKWND